MAALWKNLLVGEAPVVALFVLLGIVVGLCFALLTLVVRRVRHGTAEAPELDEEAWLHDVISERAQQLAVEQVTTDPNPAIAEENRSLKERIRFLEAKVLEYQILQEQMGSLPALRRENGDLKAELERLRTELGRPKGAA